MNQNQKNTLIAIAVIITGMLFYPPFHQILANGRSIGRGHDWLFDAPFRGDTVDVSVLIVQWLGVLIIGGIVFFVLKDKEK